MSTVLKQSAGGNFSKWALTGQWNYNTREMSLYTQLVQQTLDKSFSTNLA